MLSLMLMIAVPQTGDAATSPAPAEMCSAAPAEALVGERYRRGVSKRAKVLSGARIVRVVLPGEIVTQEFREDRLTLRVDHRRLITAVRCG